MSEGAEHLRLNTLMKNLHALRNLCVLSVVVAPLLGTLAAQEAAPVPVAKADPAMAAEATEEEAEAVKPPKLDCDWLTFPDSAKFKVLGLYWFEANTNLWRMPKAGFESLPKGVKARSRCPSGGRILLKCDTSQLGLKVVPQNKGATSQRNSLPASRALRATFSPMALCSPSMS